MNFIVHEGVKAISIGQLPVLLGMNKWAIIPESNTGIRRLPNRLWDDLLFFLRSSDIQIRQLPNRLWDGE